MITSIPARVIILTPHQKVPFGSMSNEALFIQRGRIILYYIHRGRNILYSQPPIIKMKTTARTTVHQIPLFTSLEETWSKTHKAPLTQVKMKTEAVTADPALQCPSKGPSQLYLGLKVPASWMTSDPGVVGSEVEAEISEAGVKAGLGGI